MSGRSSHDLFEILAREHAEMLLVYLRATVRNAALVDDLFQETMITAWKTLDRFDRSRPFGPWLRGIAAKLILAERRKGARGLALCDAEILERIDAQQSAIARLSGDTFDDKLQALRDCVGQLPETYRLAVQLRYQEGLVGGSLAERLAVPVETMKKRLQRARSRLLDCIHHKLALSEAQA